MGSRSQWILTSRIECFLIVTMVAPSVKHLNDGRDLKSWKVITFFFSNFPDNYSEPNMWEHFQRWERIEEVFISWELNRWRNRFGFVRFSDVKNVSKLEIELDFICIGSMKLFANLPRYRKNEAPQHVRLVPQVRMTKQTNHSGKVS